MAKENSHVYRLPKGHKVASALKPGESMAVRMRRLDDDEESEGDEGTVPMEEEMAEAHHPPAPPRKKVDPIQAVKDKRAAAK